MSFRSIIMNKVDLIVNAWQILPVIPRNTLLKNHSLIIHNSKIIDILPMNQQQYIAEKTVNYDNHIVMPGFINAHTHTPMTLLRGMGDALPLKNWLEDCIWPIENQLMSEEFVADGTKIGVAEMLLNGTTCFSECYFLPDVAANTCRELGIRTMIGIGLHDSAINCNADRNHQLIEKLMPSSDDMISFAYAPHSPYMLSDQGFARLLDYCQKYPAPIHIHMHETSREIVDSFNEHGMSPLARLEKLGVLAQHIIAVHMVHLDQNDYDILSQNPCHIITCPDSNLKLGSGICNINKLQELGLNVGVGTDGAASNNDLDILAEARNAALLNKGVNQNPELSPAHEILEMLTINGAKAIGLEQKIGSLEVGKYADFIAWDTNNLNSYPKHDLVAQVVFAGNAIQVTDVWVNGQQLVAARQLTKLSMRKMLETAEKWQNRTTNLLGGINDKS